MSTQSPTPERMLSKRGPKSPQSLESLRHYRSYTSGHEDQGAYCPTEEEIDIEAAKIRATWKDRPRRSRLLDSPVPTVPYLPRFAIKLDCRHNGEYLVGRT